MGLAKSVALEATPYKIRIITCPGEVDTKMWQDFDPSYYKLNKNKMLKANQVAGKIVEMIFDAKHYKNGKVVLYTIIFFESIIEDRFCH